MRVVSVPVLRACNISDDQTLNSLCMCSMSGTNHAALAHAGMSCIAVPELHNRKDPRYAIADCQLDSLGTHTCGPVMDLMCAVLNTGVLVGRVHNGNMQLSSMRHCGVS